MFGAIYAAEVSSPEALLAVAQEFSPRVDAGSHDRDFREIVLDLHGLTRLFGDTRTIAEELRRTAASLAAIGLALFFKPPTARPAEV